MHVYYWRIPQKPPSVIEKTFQIYNINYQIINYGNVIYFDVENIEFQARRAEWLEAKL